jgi:uncharacterized FlaG/YvyC family protein
MKKNILLVPSLLLLPLLSSSAIFASEVGLKGRAAKRKKQQQLASSREMKRSTSEENLITALAPQQPEADLSQQIIGGIQAQLKTIAEPVVFTSAPTLAEMVITVVNKEEANPVVTVLETTQEPLHSSVVITDEVPPCATNEELTLLRLTKNNEIPLTTTNSNGKELGYAYSAMEAKANFAKKINSNDYQLRSAAPAVKSVAQPAEEAAPELMPRKSKIAHWETIAENYNQVLAEIATAVKTRTAKKVADTVNSFELSVYEPAPTMKQGFGSWTESIKNRWNPQWFVVDAIKDGSFDPENESHIAALMAAAEKLVFEEKSAELKDLLDACRANEKYRNIELDEKTALKIQKRFALDLKNAVETPCKVEASAREKLMIAHKAILERSRDQIDAFEKQLEKNREELAKAEFEYALATSDTLELHNKKAQQTIDGMEVLHKLYRKFPTSDSITLDRHNYAYLPVKAKVDKQIETTFAGMTYSLNNLEGIHSTIKNTLKTLPAKEAVVQIANK